MTGVVGLMAVAAAALTGLQSGPQQVQGLQHASVQSLFPTFNGERQSGETTSADVGFTSGTFQEDFSDSRGLSGVSGKISRKSVYTVDFGSVITESFAVEERMEHIDSQTRFPRTYPRTYSQDEISDYIAKAEVLEACNNNRHYAIEKARELSNEVGTEGPPNSDQMDGLQLPMSALAGQRRVIRVWDTGATAGMTRPGSTAGVQRQGRTARIATGGGSVKTNVWIDESLPWGELRHVGLEHTTNTASAGQHNAELGIATSWLEPPVTGHDAECGPCLVHKSDGGHIVWGGAHRFQKACIRGRTPEFSDAQQIKIIDGKFCATPSCSCELPTLSEAISQIDQSYALAGAESDDDVRDPTARSSGSSAEPASAPPMAGEAGEAKSGGSTPKVIDYYSVDRATQALHGADGRKCGCPLCKSVKQRRHGAKSESHPHAEDKIRMVAGAHTFGDIAVY